MFIKTITDREYVQRGMKVRKIRKQWILRRSGIVSAVLEENEENEEKSSVIMFTFELKICLLGSNTSIYYITIVRMSAPGELAPAGLWRLSVHWSNCGHPYTSNCPCALINTALWRCILRYEDILGNGGINPRILNLGARWMWVVSFTPRPLYPQGKTTSGTHWRGDWVGLRSKFKYCVPLTVIRNDKEDCWNEGVNLFVRDML
jgi:hypothetical protein